VGIVLAPWTEIDEAELIAYGRFEEQKKRVVERAYQKMNTAEKEVFKRKMAKYDETDANHGETLPPTPTPV
jgi:hypothetical protein